MRQFVVKKNDAGQRLDKFVMKMLKTIPKSLLYKFIRLKRIKLNGRRCEASAILKEDDVVSLYINDEFFELKQLEYDFLNAPVDLNIVYEDEHLLLIDKPPGIVVHQDNEKNADCLVNRMKHYLYQKGKYNPVKENSFSPALCNRIDRNTGGIVIAAKDAQTLRCINEKIRTREIIKRYLCLTEGVPKQKEGVLHHYLDKDSLQNKVRIQKEKTASNKEVITKYRVLKTDGRHSLIEAELLTGRSHQIRAHMAYIGCPIAGDGKYGGKEKRKYHALYSYQLCFAFKTDAGNLNYLNGKTFQVEKVWFQDEIK